MTKIGILKFYMVVQQHVYGVVGNVTRVLLQLSADLTEKEFRKLANMWQK